MYVNHGEICQLESIIRHGYSDTLTSLEYGALTSCLVVFETVVWETDVDELLHLQDLALEVLPMEGCSPGV